MQPSDIEAIRNRLGLTQEDFGKLLGVSRVTVGGMESGRVPIEKRSYAPLRFLAHSLDVRDRNQAHIDRAKAEKLSRKSPSLAEAELQIDNFNRMISEVISQPAKIISKPRLELV